MIDAARLVEIQNKLNPAKGVEPVAQSVPVAPVPLQQYPLQGIVQQYPLKG